MNENGLGDVVSILEGLMGVVEFEEFLMIDFESLVFDFLFE